ncbi:hypothetical protein COHA_008030 [Chlorella ohadii]|uniref:Protein kinase domain-containing protein n=1 Tax=Chlorella ohadii TaxID=2649997 RepID=A0AAD5DI81_9CHLO|nr:hypothetical protein COHA_008030 [Chlorella ohadii]
MQLQVAHQVNAHLNSEVERLTLAVDALEQEKAAFQRHIKDLAQKLVAMRAQLPEAAAAAAQAAEEEAAEEAEAAAAGGELQSDAFAAAQRGQAGSDGSGGSGGSGGEGGEQPWLAEAAWQRMQVAGRRQGWLADPEEVVLGEVIGRGTFGVVHQATWRGGCVAVKRVQPRSREQATTFVREVEALALLRHPHVMQLYAACVRPPGDFWLVCELLSGGTLAEWLYGGPTARRLPARSLSERLKMALDVARGMQALEAHEPQILHRDLKPSNVVAAGSLHPPTPPDCHPALAELLASIFSPDPLERPSFGLIVARLEAVLHDPQPVAPAAAAPVAMLVPLTADEGSKRAWALIEMQGELERKDGGTLDEAFDVGTLSVSSSGSVLLTIGYHQLEGKRMELKKPFAVLDRVTGSGSGEEGQDSTQYKVIGVVREKILFKARPRALITKPGGKK